MKEQLKKDLQAHNSYVSKHFMAYEIPNENYIFRYVKIHLQMWINVKKMRFEGTNDKRGIIGTIEMSRNTPSPGKIPSGMYIY